MTKLIECSCRQEFQDQRYGRGSRVHNKTKEAWRCTGCGATRKS